MKRRIYRHMLCLTLLCLTLLAGLMTWFFAGLTLDTARADVREKAVLLAAAAQGEADVPAYLAALAGSLPDERLTLIAPDGDVRYDSAAAGHLENHARRAEFQQAAQLGMGEATRFSDTLGTLTTYHALRLPDGSVLRLARTVANIRSVLWRALPVLALLLLAVSVLGNVLAARLTRAIVRPIQAMAPDADAAVYDELTPLVRTIAQQKQSLADQEGDLTRRAQMIEAIADSMREGLVLLDENGTVVMANPCARLLLGAPSSVAGQNLLALTRDLTLVEGAKAALDGQRAARAFPQGERTLQVFFAPAPDRGAMLLLLDITEKAQAEAARAAFSANVSHELKTPLTSIYGYAELLRSDMVPASDVAACAGKIEAEAQRLIGLIEDILKLSKLDEGGVRVQDGTEMNLLALAEEVADDYAAHAEAQGVSLVVEGTPVLLRGERAMLRELLCNLIDNAIKYNRPNGQVTVCVEARAEDALLQVCDTGIGIPAVHQTRIFERFYRVDPSRSQKVAGTGLGLAIVKHIALAHSGTVSVASREGAGTTITVTLPRESAHRQ